MPYEYYVVFQYFTRQGQFKITSSCPVMFSLCPETDNAPVPATVFMTPELIKSYA
jgi:hypothetical protein